MNSYSFTMKNWKNILMMVFLILFPMILIILQRETGHHFWIGAGVRDHEVLPAGLAHDTRIAAVLGQVVADGLPDVAEHLGAAGEMDAREVLVREDHIAGRGPIDVDEVDHARRKPRRHEDLHEHLRAVALGIGALPHHGVAHEGAAGREIARDGREVEGSEGEDEAFERAVLQPVPHAG